MTNEYPEPVPMLQKKHLPIPIFRDDIEANPFWHRSSIQFIVIFIIALALRAVQFFSLRANDPSFAHLLPSVDTKVYDDLARTILGGDWMLQSTPIHFNGPLYPYFLAAVHGIFGNNYDAVHAVQYLLGACSAAILYHAARQWFSNRVAFIAGLFPALSATLIVYEGYLLPEALIVFLVALFILVMGLIRRHPDRRWLWLLLGITLGIPAIQRANILLCAVGIAIWVASGFDEKNRRNQFIKFAFFLAGVAIAITPATLHNRVFGGQWVLVTSNGGFNFYIGNGVEARGEYSCGKVCEDRAAQVSAGSVTWPGILINEIESDPGRWLTLMLKKTYIYWGAYDPPDNFNYALYKNFSPVTETGQFPYYFVATLGFIGMVGVWSRRRRLIELYLFVCFYAISVILIFASGRFRLLTIMPMSIFAAIAIWTMVEWVQSRRWAGLASAAASVLSLLFILNLYDAEPFPIRINDYSMLANYYLLANKPLEAISVMQEGVKEFETYRPSDASIAETRKHGLFFGRSLLAELLFKAGRLQETKEVLEKQIQSGDFDDSWAENLIATYVKLGEKNHATEFARQMSDKSPDKKKWQMLLQQTEALP